MEMLPAQMTVWIFSRNSKLHGQNKRSQGNIVAKEELLLVHCAMFYYNVQWILHVKEFQQRQVDDIELTINRVNLNPDSAQKQ